jgi:hypoxanthine phosphoribosyltransferase
MSFPASPIMIREADVLRRVAELAAEIGARFRTDRRCSWRCWRVRGCSRPTSRGTSRDAVFGMRAASYGAALSSSGSVQIDVPQEIPVRGRSIVLIEDIVDTGRTVRAVSERSSSAAPAKSRWSRC